MPLITLALMVIGGIDVQGQWQRVTLPGKYNTQMYLDVQFLPADPRFGWACSMEGGVVRTTDRGATWAGVDIPNGEVFLEHIQFLDRFRGYTSGPGGIYKSVDGGATWTNISPQGYSSATENGWGCYFTDVNTGVFLSGGCAGTAQSFYYTQDGGASWRRDVHFERNRGLTDALIFPDGTGLATSSGLLWETKNGGRNWSPLVQTPVNAWTEEITFRNGIMLLPTAGNSCSGGGDIEGTLQWGETPRGPWRVFQTGQNMYGTFIVDDLQGWGVGSAGACYFTADAGRTWTLRDCGINGADLDDIWFITENEGWIAGRGLFRSQFGAGSTVQILGPKVVDLCPGETYTTSVFPGLVNHRWSTGDQTETVTLGPGVHIVSALDPLTCRRSSDTITIRAYPVVPPIIGSGEGGSEYCAGTTASVAVSNGPYASYRWSNGSTTNTTTVTQSGTLTVTVVDSNGCTGSATWNASFRDSIDARIAQPLRTTICDDDSVVLSAPRGYASYQWSNGSTEESIVVRSTGSYSVRVVDDLGCDDTSNVVDITVLNLRNRIDLTLNFRPFVVPDHNIGDASCADVTIGNLDSNSSLVINRPWVVGNVILSLPLSQFPLIIPPLGRGVMRLCAAAIDSGWVSDTIVFADTCRPQVLPVRTYGKSIEFQSLSRCEIPIGITAYTAGSSHKLSSPIPNPAVSSTTIYVQTPASSGVPSLSVISPTGIVVARGTIAGRISDGITNVFTYTINVEHLYSGTYVLFTTDGNTLNHAQTLTIIR